MSYVSRCNILIASPSDVAAERDEVFRTIATWNGSLGNADRRVVFVPLMWEQHAISDADQAPQAAINQQLLERADLILAIFSSRLGTPTQDYPAGTIEELSRRTGKAAVFFRESSHLDMNAADLADRLEQLKKLAEFQKGFAGFARKYKDTTDLGEKVRDQLDGWSKQLQDASGLPLVALPAPWTFHSIAQHIEPKGNPLCLLFYNVELATFRSPEVFAERWALIADYPCVKRIIFLLPGYKIDRLRGLLPRLVGNGNEALLQRFYVCPQKEPSKPGTSRDRVSSSLAFVMACRGSDPDSREFLPFAEMAILSEPFASAVDWQEGSPDLQWDYNYHLEVDGEEILTTLRRIWRERYDEERVSEMLMLLTQPGEEADVDHALEQMKLPGARLKNEETYNLITQLRAKLFDPNVPSYLLNDVFELLDWNPAFELVFPTTRFYRNMSVKEFVECLDNSGDVKRHGLELTDSAAIPFDMEQLVYTSPLYGKMRFTKIASRVIDPMTEKTCGWIVALNVNHVEHWQVYEDDLKRTNEEQSLISLYAPSADRILGSFPGYRNLVHAHVEAVHGCRNVLDLGAGPGFLTAELLSAGLAVTSLDINDAMIDITRRRCGACPNFTAVKANVESLHSPNEFYDANKIGISPPYDGACMLNIYQWLHNPPVLLRRLFEDELLSARAPLTISLPSGEREIEEQFRAINYLKQYEQRQHKTFKGWEPVDFQRFASVMQQFIGHGIAGRYSPDGVEAHLKQAGYQILDRRRVAYQVGDRTFEGFPFFLAQAPHG